MKGADVNLKKRYVLLFTFTALIILGILSLRPVIKKSSTEVSLYEIRQENIEESVNCAGRVESADSKNVYVEIPCIAQRVNVKAGDKVNEGDVLFTIDTEATKQAFASSGVASSIISSQTLKKTVTAPASGIVSSLNVASGEAIGTDNPCAVISSSDTLQVKVSIQEDDIKKIKIGQKATVSGTAFTKTGYPGKVTYISPSARQQYSGTISETVIDVIVTFTDKDDSIKPGLSAKSKIDIGETPECLIVPYEYVLEDDDNQEYVYVYENGCAVKRIVETGKECSKGFEIVSGLASGDQVIANPGAITKPGEKVDVQKEGVL